jgi:hypothetical protein
MYHITYKFPFAKDMTKQNLGEATEEQMNISLTKKSCQNP